MASQALKQREQFHEYHVGASRKTKEVSYKGTSMALSQRIKKPFSLETSYLNLYQLEKIIKEKIQQNVKRYLRE